MSSGQPSSPFRARQERLRALMEARGVPLLLISHLVNIRYLTGFAGSAGMVLVSPRKGLLWVDPRYTLQAREQADGVEVIEEKKGILKSAAVWLRQNAARDCAFEASYLTCAQFELLRKEAGEAVHLRPAGELIEELRIVKDQDELAAIRRAGVVTAEVFAEILPLIRPGVAERELAAEIDYRMRKRGAEGPAFETIVASGVRSAYPHARASAKAFTYARLTRRSYRTNRWSREKDSENFSN